MNVPQDSNLPLITLLGYLAATCAAAVIGSYFTLQVSITQYYAALIKPAWAPPGWIFAPVWTALYICMCLAIWQVWRKKPMRPSRVYSQAHACWWGQLALNALWPVIFWLQPAGMAAFVVCAGPGCGCLGLCGRYAAHLTGCCRSHASVCVLGVLCHGPFVGTVAHEHRRLKDSSRPLSFLKNLPIS